VNEEKSSLPKYRPTREDIASSKASTSKEECDRTLLEWWANYDPGMDACLHARAIATSPNSPCEVTKGSRSTTRG
jgi:hypothetical protein